MTVDMSAHAIDVRLRRVSQLRRLCLSLAKAKRTDASEERSQDREIEQPRDGAAPPR